MNDEQVLYEVPAPAHLAEFRLEMPVEGGAVLTLLFFSGGKRVTLRFEDPYTVEDTFFVTDATGLRVTDIATRQLERYRVRAEWIKDGGASYEFWAARCTTAEE